MNVNDMLNIIGWFGLYAPVCLGAIGSAIGCTVAGQAAIGAMLETEGGHGRYVGVAALPSSMVIYGIVVMFTLNRPGTVGTAGGLFGIGLATRIPLLLLGLYQGTCDASPIAASTATPAL